jgi:ferredoxin
MNPEARNDMKRKIIRIDQEKCNGCGLCATGCPEGALQVIDGKARLVGDLLCDGLGACLTTCPEDAISVEEREAEPYNERKVMENIVPQGKNVIQAHLNHLKEHGQTTFLKQALDYIKERNIEVDLKPATIDSPHAGHRCPGSQILAFPAQREMEEGEGKRPSRLTHWPIQLHLVSPNAPHYQGSDLLLAADCVAYSVADFHRDYLKDRTLAIACPKLDSNQEIYRDKLVALIEEGGIRSIKVMIMQVPCCSGLMRHVVEAANQAKRKVPVTCVVVGIRGEILREEPLQEAG